MDRYGALLQPFYDEVAAEKDSADHNGSYQGQVIASEKRNLLDRIRGALERKDHADT